MYKDYWFRSTDGLQLYARDYRHQNPRATVLCIPGLTRNAADFTQLCEHLAADFRVLAVDLRGRGQSDYDSNPNNYHPGTYVQDIITLLEAEALSSVILIGTSLGGLVSMLLTALHPQRVAAVVLNDIGPEVNTIGLEAVKQYISNPPPVNTWADAVASTRQSLGREYPDFSDQEWIDYTQNLFRENEQGQPVLDYDSHIADVIQQSDDNAVPANLWQAFETMKAVPQLLIRGQRSYILSPQCVEKMQQINPSMHFVEVPRCGHVPLLTEAVSLAAIDGLLATL